jgi:anti-sigma B factor antagonist
VDTGTNERLEVREPVPGVAVVDVVGDVTPAVEAPLLDAYARASAGGRAVVLNFDRLDYMNSGGIGLLVTLVVRAQRDRQRFLACGLSDHYRQILALTRLDEAIEIHATESDAIAAAQG